MKKLFIYFIILSSISVIGQNNQYVKADNGLIVREKPNKNSKRIGKLDYGSKVYVFEQTENKLELIDEGKTIKGNWARIKEVNGNISGFVFNGYLTTESISNNLKIRFEEFTLSMRLNIWDNENNLNKIQKDNVKIFVDLGDSPEGKKIIISECKYDKIEIKQRFENSISITDEGAHCDLINWKHYYSNWESIEVNNKYFITEKYTEKDSQEFNEIAVDELKNYVDKNCAEKFSNNIKNITKYNQYPSTVLTSRIFLKIKLENSKTGEKKEKIISFEIPMGC